MSRISVLAFLLVSAATFLFAQQGGVILGTVTDSSGAAVTNASVAIANTDTNAKTNLITNGEGLYTSSTLIPGTYTVSVEHAGFKKAIRSGITLQID